MKNILVLFMALFFFGCGLEADDDPGGTRARDLEITEKLNARYASAVGVYSGISRVGRFDLEKSRVRVKLFIAREKSGFYNDGQPRIMPVLNALVEITKLRKSSDPDIPYNPLEPLPPIEGPSPVYVAMHAQLTEGHRVDLVMSKNQPISGASDVNFSGTLVDGVLEGTFNSSYGSQWKFKGTREVPED